MKERMKGQLPTYLGQARNKLQSLGEMDLLSADHVSNSSKNSEKRGLYDPQILAKNL
jgi:hypothetical protein